MPGLMREDGDRARGLAERALVALEREPVEPVADLRASGTRSCRRPRRRRRRAGRSRPPRPGRRSGSGRRDRRSSPPRPTVAPRFAAGRRSRGRASRSSGRSQSSSASPTRASTPSSRGIRLRRGRTTRGPRSMSAGTQTWWPPVSISVGSTHSGPPSSSMSWGSGARPRLPRGVPRSRQPARRNCSSSAAKARNGIQAGIASCSSGTKNHASTNAIAAIRRRRSIPGR